MNVIILISAKIVEEKAVMVIFLGIRQKKLIN